VTAPLILKLSLDDETAWEVWSWMEMLVSSVWRLILERRGFIAAIESKRPVKNKPQCQCAGPVAEAELLAVPRGTRTEGALRHNLKVGIRYLEAWLRGQGCVALYGLMEDAATAEICRMQVWQWLHHGAEVGRLGALDRPLFHGFIQDALLQVQAELGEDVFAQGRFMEASDLFETLILGRTPAPFLTLPAYDLLLEPVLTEVE